MKFKEIVEVEHEVKIVRMSFLARHIGEADGEISPQFPLLKGNQITADVDLETGQIQGWQSSKGWEIYCKVCDAGSYFLLNGEGEIVASIENDYVPNDVIPGEYGDYIDLQIDAKGMITNWPDSPDLSDFNGCEEE